jgi:hypothetical protein
MIAKYEGRCAECRKQIARGVEIVWLGPGEGARHMKCPPPSITRPIPEERALSNYHLSVRA